MNLGTFVKLVEILSVPKFGRRQMVLVLVLILGGHHFVHFSYWLSGLLIALSANCSIFKGEKGLVPPLKFSLRKFNKNLNAFRT